MATTAKRAFYFLLLVVLAGARGADAETLVEFAPSDITEAAIVGPLRSWAQTFVAPADA